MKKFLILFFTIILILSMVACSNNKVDDNISTPPTEETEKIESVFDENFSLETTEEFRIKIDSNIIQMPMNYGEFKNKYNFENTNFVGLGMAEDQIFLVSGKLNNYDISIFLTPNADFTPSKEPNTQPDLSKTSVVGISFEVNDEIELPFKVSKDDTFESIQSKFGEPTLKMEDEIYCLNYSMYVCRVNNSNFNIAFFFDAETKKLTNIKCGDFVLLA